MEPYARFFPCLEFLRKKNSEIKSYPVTWSILGLQAPLISRMGFSFWNQATNHLRKVKPRTLDEMKRAIEDFAANLGEEAIRRMCQKAGPSFCCCWKWTF